MVEAAGAFIVFALLLPGLAPNIYVGDSQLFSTASYYLSAAHPPGYPLFITIGKLFTFIPFGSIPFRVGMIGAVFACLSWVVLFKLIKRLTGNKPMAFSFSFLPVLTPLAYVQSIEQKGVYSLNCFLALLILYLGVRAYEEDDTRFLYAMAFLFGIGAGNHHTLALFLLPALVPLWIVAVRKKRFAALLLLPFFFLSGFLIYLHLYLRSLVLVGRSFIYSVATTLNDFFYVLFRKGYAANSIQAVETLGRPHGATFLYGARNIITYVMASQYGAAMTGIFLFSTVWLLFSKERKALKAYLVLAVLPWLFILPAMTMAGSVPGEHNISVVSQYYMPLLFLLPVFISLMANRAWLYLKAKKIRTLRAAQVCLLLPFFYLPATLQHSLASNYTAYDHARDTLSVLPVNSVLLLYGDNPGFGDYYMQWVERYREDVAAFSRGAHTQQYEIGGRSSFVFNRGLFRGYMRLTDSQTLKAPYASLDALCREKRFFAVNPVAMTDVLKKRYQAGPVYGPLSYMLSVKGTPGEQANEFLLKNYRKLNYERTAMVYSNDPLVGEEKNQYGFALIDAAAITGDKAEKKRLEDYATGLVSPEDFIPWATARIIKSGGQAGALKFLRKIESGLPYSKMADLAHVMEYAVLSNAGSPQAAAKYEYLKEHGLLEYLGGAENLSRSLGMAPKKIEDKEMGRVPVKTRSYAGPGSHPRLP